MQQMVESDAVYDVCIMESGFYLHIENSRKGCSGAVVVTFIHSSPPSSPAPHHPSFNPRLTIELSPICYMCEIREEKENVIYAPLQPERVLKALISSPTICTIPITTPGNEAL